LKYFTLPAHAIAQFDAGNIDPSIVPSTSLLEYYFQQFAWELMIYHGMSYSQKTGFFLSFYIASLPGF
jgi:hypothetical protein